MMKQILIILTIILSLNFVTFAKDINNTDNNSFKQQKYSEFQMRQKNFDAMLDSRLHLTDEQKQKINENRVQYRQELQKTIKKMEYLGKKIKKIYLTKTSKIQADIESAPLKLELAMLKQKADKIRIENRKKFEQILNDDQKAEFEKIKQEFHNKKIKNKNRN